MHPVKFEGSVEIKKPENMTDEQCLSLWAKYGFDTLFTMIQQGMKLPEYVIAGVDTEGFPYYMTAWKPNKEDLEALNKGLPVYIKTIVQALPPMAVFTLDENNNPNWE